MKLRVQGNSIRLRLTRSEVMRLRDGGTVGESTDFGPSAHLIYRIRPQTNLPDVSADFSGGTVTVTVPAATIADWADSDEVGFYARQGDLRISVEKDFRCLTRPAEEQEADAYPHPAGDMAAHDCGSSGNL